MTADISLDQLLPPIFDELVYSTFGKPLRQEERDALVSSITRALIWTRLKQPKQISGQKITNFPHVVFTDDGFSTNIIDKEAIIGKMNHSTGLGREFCSLALELMEAELALLAFNADGEAVVIEEIGSFKLIADEIYSLEDANHRKQFIAQAMSDLEYAIKDLREGKTAEFFAAEARKIVRYFAAGLRRRLLQIKRAKLRGASSGPPIRYQVNLSADHFPRRSNMKIKKVDAFGS